MIEVKAIAVKRIQGKDGKIWYRPAYILPDGDIVQEFTEKVCQTGSTLVLVPYMIQSEKDSRLNGKCGLRIAEIK